MRLLTFLSYLFFALGISFSCFVESGYARKGKDELRNSRPTIELSDDSHESEAPGIPKSPLRPGGPAQNDCNTQTADCLKPISNQNQVLVPIQTVITHEAPTDFSKLKNICLEIASTEAKQRESLSYLKNSLFFQLPDEQHAVAQEIENRTKQKEEADKKAKHSLLKGKRQEKQDAATRLTADLATLEEDLGRAKALQKLLKDGGPDLQIMVTKGLEVEKSLNVETCEQKLAEASKLGHADPLVEAMFGALNTYLLGTLRAYQSFNQRLGQYNAEKRQYKSKPHAFTQARLEKLRFKSSWGSNDDAGSLIVKPYQRLPRMELFLKDLLKAKDTIQNERLRNQLVELKASLSSAVAEIDAHLEQGK